MKFEIHKQYKNGDGVFTCVKRSSKSVWLKGENGYIFKRPFIVSNGNELLKLQYHILTPANQID